MSVHRERTKALSSARWETGRRLAGAPGAHLAVVGDGLLVLVDDVLGAQAVLGASDLSAGVGVYAVGGEGTCTPREGKERIFGFSVSFPYESKRGAHTR